MVVVDDEQVTDEEVDEQVAQRSPVHPLPPAVAQRSPVRPLPPAITQRSPVRPLPPAITQQSPVRPLPPAITQRSPVCLLPQNRLDFKSYMKYHGIFILKVFIDYTLCD